MIHHLMMEGLIRGNTTFHLLGFFRINTKRLQNFTVHIKKFQNTPLKKFLATPLGLMLLGKHIFFKKREYNVHLATIWSTFHIITRTEVKHSINNFSLKLPLQHFFFREKRHNLNEIKLFMFA